MPRQARPCKRHSVDQVTSSKWRRCASCSRQARGSTGAGVDPARNTCSFRHDVEKPAAGAFFAAGGAPALGVGGPPVGQAGQVAPAGTSCTALHSVPPSAHRQEFAGSCSLWRWPQMQRDSLLMGMHSRWQASQTCGGGTRGGGCLQQSSAVGTSASYIVGSACRDRLLLCRASGGPETERAPLARPSQALNGVCHALQSVLNVLDTEGSDMGCREQGERCALLPSLDLTSSLSVSWLLASGRYNFPPPYCTIVCNAGSAGGPRRARGTGRLPAAARG